MKSTKKDETLLTVPNDYWVNLYNALQRLKDTDDFKIVISNGYSGDNVINLVSQLSGFDIDASQKRAKVIELLIGVSGLMNYFTMVESLGTSVEPEVKRTSKKKAK